MLRILYHTLCIALKCRLHRLSESDCFCRIGVYVWSSLHTRKYSSIDRLLKIFFIVDKSSSWSAECFMGRGSYYVEVCPGSLDCSSGDKSRSVCDVRHENRTISVFFLYFFCNIFKFFPFNVSRICGKPSYDKRRLMGKCLLLELCVVDQHSFGSHAV